MNHRFSGASALRSHVPVALRDKPEPALVSVPEPENAGTSGAVREPEPETPVPAQTGTESTVATDCFTTGDNTAGNPQQEGSATRSMNLASELLPDDELQLKRRQERRERRAALEKMISG